MLLATPRIQGRAAFISDLHLGSPEARPRELTEFLSVLSVDTLYLVGDVIDLYWMRKRAMRWSADASRVIDALRQLAQRGTRLVYVPGNHDAPVRQLAGWLLPGLEIRRQYVHRGARGQRFWITHGDQFDGLIHAGPLLQWLGDGAYRVLLGLERVHRAWARVRRRPAWSLAAWLKRQSTAAERYVEKFVTAITAEAERRGFDGVICGHIHRAEIRRGNNVIYMNDGDWVENLSAVIESADGSWHITRWTGWPLQNTALVPEHATRF